MARRRFLVSVLLFSAVVAFAASSAYAQQGNGVVVDADGVLRTRVFPDPTGMLTRQRLAAAWGEAFGVSGVLLDGIRIRETRKNSVELKN